MSMKLSERLDRLSRAAEGDGASANAPPRGAMHLVRCLSELGAAWSGRPQPEAGAQPETAGTPTPAVLALVAADLSMEISHRPARSATLAPADFPCIVFLRSGLARILVRRTEQGFVCLAGGIEHEIGAEALKAEEAGTIFFPKPVQPISARSKDAGAAGNGLLKNTLRDMLSGQRGLVLQLLLTAAFGNLMLLAVPVFTMAVFDRVIPHGAMETLWALSIGVTLALLVDMAVRYVRLKLHDALAIAAVTRLHARIFEKLLTVPLKDAPKSPGTITRQMHEVEGICQLIPAALSGLLVDVPFLAVIIALLVHIGGPVAVVPLIGLAGLIALHLLCEALGRASDREAVHLARKQADLVVETITEIEAIKASVLEHKRLELWEHLADRAAYAGHVSRLWSGISGYSNIFAGQLVLVLVVLVSVYEITAGAMTVGALSAAMMLTGRAIGPIGQLAVMLHKTRSTLAAVQGLDTLLKAASESGAAGEKVIWPRSDGEIAFRNVTYAYSGSEAQLDRVSFTITPGERVGIIGRSGSGKSTALRLIARFHDPDQGAVLYDRIDVRQYAPGLLRGQIGFMRQDPSLFDDTIAANIALDSRTLDRSRFDRAVLLSNVQEIAARRAEGYGYVVGPRGERLSGGERQCVLLARLLYADPAVFLFDEPTAAMDTILEATVLQRLKPHLAGKTLIIATHRAPPLALVDRLIWLDQGRVVADGKKTDVLSRMGRSAA